MKSLRHLYFPLTIPHPKRAGKWKCLRSYQEQQILPGTKLLALNKIQLPAPVPAAVGKKLFCFADLHCSTYNGQISREIRQLVAETTPDYLLTMGDLVGFGSEMELLENFLAQFRDLEIPRIAIPGNWERGKNWLPLGYWHELFRRNNWQFLCNQGFADEIFYFYGTDDPGKGFPELKLIPYPDRCQILLAHRPDTVIALDFKTRLLDFDIALCGHTHGGQIRLPFIGSICSSSCYGTRFNSGIFQRPGLKTKLIVTSGCGERTLPWRFNCRREVLLLEFTSLASPQS